MSQCTRNSTTRRAVWHTVGKLTLELGTIEFSRAYDLNDLSAIPKIDDVGSRFLIRRGTGSGGVLETASHPWRKPLHRPARWGLAVHSAYSVYCCAAISLCMLRNNRQVGCKWRQSALPAGFWRWWCYLKRDIAALCTPQFVSAEPPNRKRRHDKLRDECLTAPRLGDRAA